MTSPYHCSSFRAFICIHLTCCNRRVSLGWLLLCLDSAHLLHNLSLAKLAGIIRPKRRRYPGIVRKMGVRLVEIDLELGLEYNVADICPRDHQQRSTDVATARPGLSSQQRMGAP